VLPTACRCFSHCCHSPPKARPGAGRPSAPRVVALHAGPLSLHAIRELVKAAPLDIVPLQRLAP